MTIIINQIDSLHCSLLRSLDWPEDRTPVSPVIHVSHTGPYSFPCISILLSLIHQSVI
jgi:hypothetical protein